jgi:hypothetical protein
MGEETECADRQDAFRGAVRASAASRCGSSSRFGAGMPVSFFYRQGFVAPGASVVNVVTN